MGTSRSAQRDLLAQLKLRLMKASQELDDLESRHIERRAATDIQKVSDKDFGLPDSAIRIASCFASALQKAKGIRP